MLKTWFVTGAGRGLGFQGAKDRLRGEQPSFTIDPTGEIVDDNWEPPRSRARLADSALPRFGASTCL